jgi:hypothetical protein
MYYVTYNNDEGENVYLGPREFYGEEYAKDEGFPNRTEAELAKRAAEQADEMYGLYGGNKLSVVCKEA